MTAIAARGADLYYEDGLRGAPQHSRGVAMLALAVRLVPWLAAEEQAIARLALIPAGFLPVTLIAASAFGVAGLRELATVVLVPVLVIAALPVARQPRLGRLVAAAIVGGIVATACYDAFRFSFIGLGLMSQDPIPHIGAALGLRPAWAFGYLWRYAGNGAGLAVAFFALGLRGTRVGVVYGLVVCAGLMVVLVASPHGQQMLFPLNATTVVMATGGHIIYGAVLGTIARTRSSSPAERAVSNPRTQRMLGTIRHSGNTDDEVRSLPVGEQAGVQRHGWESVVRR